MTLELQISKFADSSVDTPIQTIIVDYPYIFFIDNTVRKKGY